MNFTLKRDTYNQKETLGKLSTDGLHLCETLELPWKENKRNISCIPKGTYKMVKRYTAARGWHLRIINVPGRSLILIHSGNTHKDIQGCICPGLKRGQIGTENAVLNSRTTVKKVNDIAFAHLDKGKEVTITIS